MRSEESIAIPSARGDIIDVSIYEIQKNYDEATPYISFNSNLTKEQSSSRQGSFKKKPKRQKTSRVSKAERTPTPSYLLVAALARLGAIVGEIESRQDEKGGNEAEEKRNCGRR